jgi:serine/threonine-protein kinase
MSPDNTSSSALRVLGGRYELRRLIARGGMAEVYLARDSSLDRPVAIKVLFPEFATDPAFVERFRREAQSAANLSHPNIAGVYDWGNEAGTYFIVMEYIEGRSLSDLMRTEGPLEPHRAAEIAFDIAGALGAAHARGVVHRDVKPGNVLINSHGVPKVVDFGIARALESPSEELTQAGSVMGTASYFSPEQAQGFAVDARSDLYSLGVVLYEMVTGRPPFTGDTPVAIAYKHVQEAPPRPSGLISGLPVGLEAVIGKLLAKHPDNRYRSADDLRADLRRYLNGETPLALLEQQGQRPADATTVVPAAAAAAGATTVMPAMTAATPVAAAPATTVHRLDEQGPEDEGRNKLFIAMVAVLLLALGGLVAWLLISANKKSATPAQVDVPSVVGLQRADAEKALTNAKFKVTFQERPDPTASKDSVVDQVPKGSTKADEGSTVVVTLSSGPGDIQVPANLVGMTEADAKKALTALGLKPESTPVADSTAEAGRVVSVTPDSGATVKPGDTVKLGVSNGPSQVPIPDVTGKTEAAAKALLEKAGFKVGPSEQVASDTVAKGKVMGTNPATEAPKGSTVAIQISSGKGDQAVPSVKGQSEADATKGIKDKGFDVNVTPKPIPASDPNVGRVIDQAPAGGSTAAPGSVVSITVGVAATPSTTTASSTAVTTTTSVP